MEDAGQEVVYEWNRLEYHFCELCFRNSTAASGGGASCEGSKSCGSYIERSCWRTLDIWTELNSAHGGGVGGC